MRMLKDFKPESKLGSDLSPSLRDLPPSLYAVLNRCSDYLFLPGLNTLDAATAKALASGNVWELDLSGLRSLDAEATRELAKGTIVRTGGSIRRDAGLQILHLSGLESLDAATAKALADGEVEELFLSGLRTLDADAAKALGAKRHWQRLDLRSLRTLDAAAATAFKDKINTCGVLNLSGLESLDAATATALVTGDYFFLDLSGVRSLDVATATALAAGSATLDLSGLTSLDRDVAQALSNRRLGDRMVLDGLTTLDAETAKALMSGPGGKGGYWLNGLRSLDAATATALVASGAPSMLLLDGLESLDADTAAALTSGPYEANRVRRVSLRGLDSLEPAAAEAFSKALDCRRCHADVPTPTLGGCRGGIPEISLSIGVRERNPF